MNIDPVYPKTPNISWDQSVTVANNTADITTGTSYLIFTAGSNGSYVDSVVVKPAPAVNTSATVVRVWLNNGSATGTAANSVLIDEITVPATTTSATLAQPTFAAALRRAIPAGYKLYVTAATDPGATNLHVTCFGADY